MFRTTKPFHASNFMTKHHLFLLVLLALLCQGQHSDPGGQMMHVTVAAWLLGAGVLMSNLPCENENAIGNSRLRQTQLVPQASLLPS
jgi:hypothetical protein